MSVRICTLVVIYNRAPEEAAAIESLCASVSSRVLIVDNSTVPNEHFRYAAKHGFGYVSMGGNRGLAAAYNRGIAWIKKHTDATHVLLLDDDTTLPDGFFEHTLRFMESHPQAQIVLPRVEDEKGLLSPCRIEGYHVTRVEDVEALTASTVTAINSGMVLDLQLFDRYRYDEEYFLDYIDHAFMRDMKARGVTVAVTTQTLTQQFFGNQRGDRAAAKRRLGIFKQDFRRFCGRSFKGRLMAQAVIIKRTIRMLVS